MKFPHLFLTLTVALSSLASALGPVDILIDQNYRTDSDKKKGDTQNKSLKITVINNSRVDLAGLKVKYYFFSRDIESHDLSLLDKGETPADVKAVSKTVVETKTVTATSKPGKGKKKPSGDKIMGYGLRIFDSTGKMLIERYEPPSMKEEVEKSDPAPK